MPLSESQIQRVIRHLQERVQSGCPMCGGRDWNVERDLHFQGILDPEYKQPEAGKVFPVITVTCKNCYFTYQIPAMQLGVL